MTKLVRPFLFVAILLGLWAPAYATDGVMLINQATVLASGGFPYVISTSGTYRLSGNLVVASGDGIHINADNVTLDLNGFTITGSSASSSIGIKVPSSQMGIAIRGGTLNMWYVGVVASSSCTSCQFQQLLIHGTSYGITVNGGTSVLITGNTIQGVSSTIGQCIDNAASATIISSNTVTNCAAGISTVQAANITGNVAQGNGAGGIVAGAGSNISANEVQGNAGAGISALSCPSNLVGNTATGNGTDISVTGSGCTRYNNNPSP